MQMGGKGAAASTTTATTAPLITFSLEFTLLPPGAKAAPNTDLFAKRATSYSKRFVFLFTRHLLGELAREFRSILVKLRRLTVCVSVQFERRLDVSVTVAEIRMELIFSHDPSSKVFQSRRIWSMKAIERRHREKWSIY